MILITGGLGFIGVHAIAAFLEVGKDVVVTTRSRSTRVPDFLAAHVNRRLFIEPADVADEDALQVIARRHGVDGIVHLARRRGPRRRCPSTWCRLSSARICWA